MPYVFELTSRNGCRLCGQDFTSLQAFDVHRSEPNSNKCLNPLDVGLELDDSGRWRVVLSEKQLASLDRLRGDKATLTPALPDTHRQPARSQRSYYREDTPLTRGIKRTKTKAEPILTPFIRRKDSDRKPKWHRWVYGDKQGKPR